MIWRRRCEKLRLNSQKSRLGVNSEWAATEATMDEQTKQALESARVQEAELMAAKEKQAAEFAAAKQRQDAELT